VNQQILHEVRSSAKTKLARELTVRGCEASLLAATIAAQCAGLDDLVDDLAQLHQRVGAERRAIECAADAPNHGAAA